jgi:hypothetical protein
MSGKKVAQAAAGALKKGATPPPVIDTANLPFRKIINPDKDFRRMPKSGGKGDQTKDYSIFFLSFISINQLNSIIINSENYCKSFGWRGKTKPENGAGFRSLRHQYDGILQSISKI